MTKQGLITFCLAIAVIAMASGCANRYTEEGLNKRFVGKSKSYLLGCAGAPSSQQKDGSQEFLTYETEAQSGYYSGYQGGFNTSSCRMNFTVMNGSISNVSFSSFGHWANPTQACDRMMGACN